MIKLPDVDSIFVSGAGICNLNCSYCYLNHKNLYSQFHDEVMRAWADGSYANNIISVINRICHPTRIKHLNVLGAEPSIGCGEIADNLSKLKEAFINLDEVFIATNFFSNINNLEKLIKATNDNKISEFTLHISIDGLNDSFSTTGHNVTEEIYRKNFDQLYHFFEQNDLTNLKKVIILFRSTADLKVVFKEFDTPEKIGNYIIKYYSFYREIIKKFKSLNKNILIDLRLPDIGSPMTSTTEEGLQYADVIRRYQHTLDGYPEYREFIKGPNVGGKFNSFMKLGKWYSKGQKLNMVYSGCGYSNRIVILPNGTVSQCGDWFAQTSDSTLKNLKEENYFEYIGEVINKQNNWDMNNLSDNEWVNKWIETGYTSQGGMALFKAMDYAIAEELAKSGQILKLYQNNPVKVTSDFNGYFWLHCPNRNTLHTHVPCLGNVGSYRAALNGAGAHETEWLRKELKDKYEV